MTRKPLLLAAVLGLATVFSNPVLAQGEAQRIINSNLSSINDTYRGQHQFFSDDPIGNLFTNIANLIAENILKPFWSGLLQGDPLCLVIAAALSLVAAGFLLRAGARLFDKLA
jgi:hypothetical protein